MTPHRQQVDDFIGEYIDSVPHLEALLLLWREQRETWTADSVAHRLWINPDHAKALLQDLIRADLVHAVPGTEHYRYSPHPSRDELMRAVDSAYRRDMIQISKMIHSKASSPVRAFARAFRFKKEQD